MFRRESLVLSLTLAMSLAAVFASPAVAATAYRPDAQISVVCTGLPEWRNCDPSIAGDDIYNRTARHQKRTFTDYLTYSTEPDPRVVVFKIRIENGSTAADQFRIDADGTTAGYIVKFFRKTTNITTAVENGTFVTPVLAPGATHIIRAKVIMPCDSMDYCGQDRADRLVTVRSVGDPTVGDAVKFTRLAWECTC